MNLEFQSDGRGQKLLRNRTFRDVQFNDLQLRANVDECIQLEDCRFLNCSTSPGTCVFRKGVVLKNVEIADLKCGDAIRISSLVELDHVIIRGKSPKKLLIQPDADDSWSPLRSEYSNFRLDISQFEGEVSVVGLSGLEVRRNSLRQVVVHASWYESVPWKSLGISPFSYWRMFCIKLRDFDAVEGIFSLPPQTDKDYAETIRERDILIGCGLAIN